MARVTLIVPWLKSISPHFKPNNSLCCNPVIAARSTSVRSRIAKPLTNALISAGVRIIGARAAFRALTNEVDWVTIKQLISAGMIEENGHEISDFGTAAFCQWQSAKPRLNLNGSNLAKLASPNAAESIGSGTHGRFFSWHGCAKCFPLRVRVARNDHKVEQWSLSWN